MTFITRFFQTQTAPTTIPGGDTHKAEDTQPFILKPSDSTNNLQSSSSQSLLSRAWNWIKPAGQKQPAPNNQDSVDLSGSDDDEGEKLESDFSDEIPDLEDFDSIVDEETPLQETDVKIDINIDPNANAVPPPSQSSTTNRTNTVFTNIFSSVGTAWQATKQFIASPIQSIANATMRSVLSADYDKEVATLEAQLDALPDAEQIKTALDLVSKNLTKVIESQQFFGSSYVINFVQNNKDFTSKVVHAMLLKVLVQVAQRALHDWSQLDTATREPFAVYLINVLLARYTKVASIVDQETDPVKREVLWKASVGDLAQEYLNVILPNGYKDLPLNPMYAPILGFVVPLKSTLEEVLTKVRKETTTPYHTEAELEALKKFPGGVGIIDLIQRSTHELIAKVPALVEQYSDEVVDQYILPNLGDDQANTAAFSNADAKKRMREWFLSNILATTNSSSPEMKNLWKYAENHLSSLLIHMAYQFAKKDGVDNAGAAVANSFMSIVEPFLTANGLTLVDLDNEMQLLSEQEREKKLQEVYAPLCDTILESAGLKDIPRINDQPFVRQFLPGFLHSILMTIKAPDAKREQYLELVLNRVITSVGTVSKSDADTVRAVVDDATKVLSHTISSQTKAKVVANVDTIIETVQNKLGENSPLSSESKEFIRQFITNIMEDGNALNKEVWNNIDTIIQTAMLYATGNYLRLNTSNGTLPQQLSDVVFALTSMVRDFTPQAEADRMQADAEFAQESAAIRARYATDDAAYDKEMGQLKEKHKLALRAIYQLVVEKLMTILVNPNGDNTIDGLRQMPMTLPANMQDAGNAFWASIWTECVPDVLADIHSGTFAWKAKLEELKANVKQEYNSNLPLILAKASAAYVQEWVPQVIDEEKGSVVEGIVNAAADFFDKNGFQDSSGRNVGSGVAHYLRQHRMEIQEGIEAAMTSIGKQGSIKDMLPYANEYIESFVLEALLGFGRSLDAQYANNKDMMAHLAIRFLSDAKKSMQEINANGKKGRRFIRKGGAKLSVKTTDNYREAGNRFLNNVVKLDENVVPLPEAVRADVWALKDQVLPDAMRLIMEEILDPITLNKVVISGLKEYKLAVEEDERIEKQYQQDKARAMFRGEPLPPPPPKPQAVAQDPTQKVLNEELGSLIIEMVKASDDKMLAAIVQKTSIGPNVASSIGEAVRRYFDKMTVRELALIGMEEAIPALNGDKGKVIGPRGDERFVDEKNNEITKFTPDVAKLTPAQRKNLKDVQRKEMRALIKSVGVKEVKAAIMGPIKRWWKGFQEKFDALCAKNKVTGRLKVVADRMARAVFITALGTLLKLLTYPMRKAAKKYLEWHVDRDATRAIEMFYKGLDEEFGKQALNSTLDQMEGGIPKAVNDLLDQTRVHVQ